MTKIPKLPGFVIDHPETQPKTKSQTLHWVNQGYSVVESIKHRDEHTTTPPSPSIIQPPKTTNHSTVSTKSNGPKWLEYSNCVLRFYGFFTETVPHSSEETWRVRKVTILHYLEDDTTQVVEHRAGDGTSGGILAARRRIPVSNSSDTVDAIILGPEHFTVGRTVTVHGRTIMIADADLFTRQFYAEQGKTPQPPAIPIPVSPFDIVREQKSKGSGLSRCDPQSPTRFAETLLGRAPSTKKLQQFLEGNSHVLRYYAILNDTTNTTDAVTVTGMHPKLQYKIQYYLEDDTVEILSLRHGSATNDDATRFFARALLPKNFKSIVALGSELSHDACVTPRDLRIGGVLEVYGRKFFLFDADGYTKQWCKGNLGCSDEELAPIDVSVPPPPPIKQQLPAHNGYGDPEETAQNCKRLIPVPPKRIHHHGSDLDRVVLRFAAKLVDQPGKPPLSRADRERKLIVSYYMADGTLSMYEPVIPNTGIVGGKFLERCKAYTTTEKERRISEQDLYIGAVVEIFGRAVSLLDADDFTLQTMEQDPRTFPKADGSTILKNIIMLAENTATRVANNDTSSTANILDMLHQKASGRLTKDEFLKAMKHVTLLSDHEIVAVERKLSREGCAALESLYLLSNSSLNQ